MLSIVTLRADVVGGDPAALMTTSRALLAQHHWSFLFGPGLMPAVNALLLATVMYRFRLVPRVIPLLGLVGAPLLLASSLATMFGGHAQVSSSALLFALPIAAWEFSLGVYLTVKGFKPVVTEPDAPVVSPALAV
jgi:ABC-type branched-subunit amino acid transport system permease subunit